MTQRFFKLIPSDTKIDFVGMSLYAIIVSASLVVGSLALLFFKGLNYGVDFRGGTQIHVRFQEKKTAQQVREVLSSIGLSDAMVQSFGERESEEFLIRVQPETMNLESYRDQFQTALNSLTNNNPIAKIRFLEERMYVSYGYPVNENDIERVLKNISMAQFEIESVSKYSQSNTNEYVIQFSGMSGRIVKAFQSRIGVGKFEILQIEQVGAKVGSELRMQAIGAIIISILLILVYVWFRFDFEYAPGAILALIHDAVVVLGFFSLFQLQFDLPIVAAVLTIVGFSINDTIVIYDRIRENVKKSRDVNFPTIINQSINETLSRTILTSGMLFVAVVSLLVVGGPITFNFALAFAIGIIFGSYSTIYVAAPITIYFRNYFQRKQKL